MKPCVFIHTNPKQWLGAVVGKYALQRNSTQAERFDVRFVHTDDYPWLLEYEGRDYRRDGEMRPWLNNDLQSFTPLRFAPPQLMNFSGRALVIDPDVFAVGDVWELLSRDMQGKAIVCRSKSARKARQGKFASSVMLLDCERLQHWNLEAGFAEMFSGGRDYMDWISLTLEDRDTIGPLEARWNDFDHLDENTRLLHTTRRNTQPWKTGLSVDYRPADRFRLFPPRHWLRRGRRALFGDYKLAGTYSAHPDSSQESFFFGLVGECLRQGIIAERELLREVELGHVRGDALVLAEAAPKLS